MNSDGSSGVTATLRHLLLFTFEAETDNSFTKTLTANIYLCADFAVLMDIFLRAQFFLLMSDKMNFAGLEDYYVNWYEVVDVLDYQAYNNKKIIITKHPHLNTNCLPRMK